MIHTITHAYCTCTHAPVLSCPILTLRLNGYANLEKTSRSKTSTVWYTSMDGLSSLAPKPLKYWGHCTAPCCSLTCFLLSSTYLCLFLSLSWLKALLHTSHNTHWSTRLVVLEHFSPLRTIRCLKIRFFND